MMKICLLIMSIYSFIISSLFFVLISSYFGDVKTLLRFIVYGNH